MKLMALIHKEGPDYYQCNHCTFEGKKGNLLEHVEQHIENLLYVCLNCGYQMKTRNRNREKKHRIKCTETLTEAESNYHLDKTNPRQLQNKNLRIEHQTKYANHEVKNALIDNNYSGDTERPFDASYDKHQSLTNNEMDYFNEESQETLANDEIREELIHELNMGGKMEVDSEKSKEKELNEQYDFDYSSADQDLDDKIVNYEEIAKNDDEIEGDANVHFSVKSTKSYSRNKNLKIYLNDLEVHTFEALDIKLQSLFDKEGNHYQCKQCKVYIKARAHTLEHVERHLENLLFVCILCGYTMKRRVYNRDKKHRRHCQNNQIEVNSDVIIDSDSSIHSIDDVLKNDDKNSEDNQTSLAENMEFEADKRTLFESTVDETKNCLLEEKENDKYEKKSSKSSIEYQKVSYKNLTVNIGNKNVSINDLDTNLLKFVKLRESTNNKLVYQCQRCPEVAISEAVIKDHIESHIDNISFECIDCGFRMKKRNEINNMEHLRFCKKLNLILQN